MEALKNWRCDVCGELINDVGKGYVIWKDGPAGAHSFKIIHQQVCDKKDHTHSGPLGDFLGQRGLAYLTTFLSTGALRVRHEASHAKTVADQDEFVDFMRRVQLEGYEAARQKFGSADLWHDMDDANELYPYLPENLQRIAKDY